MENYLYTPQEAVENNIRAEVVKANLPTKRMILLGIMAGAFIALGGSVSSVAVHGIENVGLARALMGAIFPVGLMLVMLVGGELFTGNCLMIMAQMDHKICARQIVRNLFIVYFANLIGALVIDALVFFSGQLDYSAGGLGAYAIKVALAKMTIAPSRAVTSGILCNILVCLAILMASAAKDVGGKIWAIFFPIWGFVIGGFEHCVANMFYIPVGILATTQPAYVQKAAELYHITSEQCAAMTPGASIVSFLCVTLGNIIGGIVFIGAIVYLVYKKKPQV